ncbi:hypothetical protein [Paenibacillus alkalitolerans]|nr:hypothetical protein [Paenibacillus alkalitolerans]
MAHVTVLQIRLCACAPTLPAEAVIARWRRILGGTAKEQPLSSHMLTVTV